jgi:hypothetical protein
VSIYGGGFRVGEGGGVCVLARWGGRVWVLGGWVGGVSAGVWAGRALGGLRAYCFCECSFAAASGCVCTGGVWRRVKREETLMLE